jgi:integrase
LSETSKDGYSSRLEQIRVDHGHRAVAGLTKDRINSFILDPLADRPGAQLDTLKKLRILIQYAIGKTWLKHDPSLGIKRPKGKETRAWTDAELAAFERRWPLGTKQRTAYARMLNMGTARVDTHLLTWHRGLLPAPQDPSRVDMAVSEDLEKALAATPRNHVCVITTAFGAPFTVDGFSGFMRDSIKAAGITDLSCRPHGLRKTLGRLLADAGCTANEIMGALGHKTLAEAERYTREADRRRAGRRAVLKLNDHRANKSPQTAPGRLGKIAKTEGKTTS